MQVHLNVFLMRILVEMVDPLGIEHGTSSLDPVNNVAFLQQQFCEVSSVLAGDTGD
jgi:hypothetical protein